MLPSRVGGSRRVSRPIDHDKNHGGDPGDAQPPGPFPESRCRRGVVRQQQEVRRALGAAGRRGREEQRRCDSDHADQDGVAGGHDDGPGAAAQPAAGVAEQQMSGQGQGGRVGHQPGGEDERRRAAGRIPGTGDPGDPDERKEGAAARERPGRGRRGTHHDRGQPGNEQDRHPPHAGVDGREALARLHGDERQHRRGDTRGEQEQPTTHGRILLRIGQIDQCGH